MAIQGYKRFSITPFWTKESFKNLEYVNEPFNDPELVDHWLEIGYSNRFTGDMCDMRGTQPVWNDRVIRQFERYGWKDIGTSYYRMMPGTVLPMHGDLYKKYIELFNLQGRETSIYRAIILLEDWQSGHYLEICGDVITGWEAGTVIEWNYDAPHMAANIGVTPRYTLQVTGHL
jgi:hypothetical protein